MSTFETNSTIILIYLLYIVKLLGNKIIYSFSIPTHSELIPEIFNTSIQREFFMVVL